MKSAIKRDTIQEIKSRVDLSSIIAEQIPVKRSGSVQTCICPFHEESTASFTIYDDHYYCFGCRARGDVFDFIMSQSGCSFREALLDLGRRTGVRVEDDPDTLARIEQKRRIQDIWGFAVARSQLCLREDTDAIAYLHGRGLSDETILRFRLGVTRGGLCEYLQTKGVNEAELIASGIGSKQQEGKVRDIFWKPSIVIPNLVAGRIVHISARSLDPDADPAYMHLKGVDIEHPFNIACLHSSKEPSIVEGPFDAMAMEQAGFSSAGLYGANGWKKFLPLLQKLERLYVCLDSDPAGKMAAMEVGEELGSRARIVQLPPDTDVDELLVSKGSGELSKLLQHALDPIVHKIREIPEDLPALDQPKALEPILRDLARREQPDVLAILKSELKSRFHLTSKEVDAYAQRVKTLRPKVRRQEFSLVPDTQDSPPTCDLQQVFPDIQELGLLQMPAGFIIDEEGIKALVPRSDGKADGISTVEVRVIGTPVVPAGILEDQDSGDESVDLVFRIAGKTKRVCVPRREIADSRQILELANRGISVTSINARNLVGFFDLFMARNVKSLQRRTAYSSMGWKNIGGKSFLLGENLHSVGSPAGSMSSVGCQPARLNMPGDGERRYVAGLHRSGDEGDYLAMLSVILAKYPRLNMFVCSALAPPLLQVLNGPNFIVHNGGASSLGKSTSVEIAASSWGRPDPADGGLVSNWEKTLVSAERSAAFFCDLPIFFDESQAGHPETIKRILYMVAQGMGRGRGAKDGGSQVTPKWRTVLISAGESALHEVTSLSGARMRIITLRHSLFENPNIGDEVRRIRSFCRANYGHLGPWLVQHLVANQELWPRYQEAFQEYTSQFTKAVPGNVGDRYAAYFAVMAVVRDILSVKVPLQRVAPTDLFGMEFESVCNEADQARYPELTFNWLVEFINSHMACFDPYPDPAHPPYQSYGVQRPDCIAVFPDLVRKGMTQAGFSFETAAHAWAKEGWVKGDAHNYTYPISINGIQQRMIVVPKGRLSQEMEIL